MPDNDHQLSFFWPALAIAALAALTALVLVDPRALFPTDVAVFVQFRAISGAALDSIMVAITQLGDPAVVWPLSFALFAYLAFIARAWPAALVWAGSVAFAASANTLLKYLIARERPGDLAYDGVSAFSFPSGHATVNLVVFGVLAVIVMRHSVPSLRTLAVAALTFPGAAIALSRIYLGAHWFSDVAASFLLASAIVYAAYSSYMRSERVELHPGRLLGAVAVCLFVFGGFNIYRNHGVDLARYEAARQSSAPSVSTRRSDEYPASNLSNAQ